MVKAVKRSIIAAGVLVLTVMAAAAFAAQEDGRLKVRIPADPELFSAAPQPLTVQQCGQCHPSVFQNLKDNGRKHRFQCQNCHSEFHVYNPKKNNYDAIMPKCDKCHNEPHGPKLTECGTCHTNPHTPRKVAMSATLANLCEQCHSSQKTQLTTFASKHSKVACNTCHTAHGLIPSCLNCHKKPHVAYQENATCTKCHPVHRPLQVTYPDDTPPATCGTCHTQVYGKWQKTAAKHATVSCATCHVAKHKTIPQCKDCHGAPHHEGIHLRFPQCLGCHLDVHDLPVKAKK